MFINNDISREWKRKVFSEIPQDKWAEVVRTDHQIVKFDRDIFHSTQLTKVLCAAMESCNDMIDFENILKGEVQVLMNTRSGRMFLEYCAIYRKQLLYPHAKMFRNKIVNILNSPDKVPEKHCLKVWVLPHQPNYYKEIIGYISSIKNSIVQTDFLAIKDQTDINMYKIPLMQLPTQLQSVSRAPLYVEPRETIELLQEVHGVNEWSDKLLTTTLMHMINNVFERYFKEDKIDSEDDEQNRHIMARMTFKMAEIHGYPEIKNKDSIKDLRDLIGQMLGGNIEEMNEYHCLILKFLLCMVNPKSKNFPEITELVRDVKLTN